MRAEWSSGDWYGSCPPLEGGHTAYPISPRPPEWQCLGFPFLAPSAFCYQAHLQETPSPQMQPPLWRRECSLIFISLIVWEAKV